MDVFLKWKIARIILTSLYLMTGWILFTGTLALFSLFLGGIFSFCVALLTYSVFIEEKEIVHFRTRLKSDLARVILANSISLTPGTVTLDLDEDHLVVHWLNAETTHSHFAGKLIKGHFESWLKRIWI